MPQGHLVNPVLLGMAKKASLGGFPGLTKQGFIPGSDPGMGAAGGGAPPPGGDPSGGGGGGGPPPGMDPSAGGGAPPSDPSGGGDAASVMQQVLQKLNQMQMAGGPGGGGQGALKPKVDVNSVLLQLLKMQARICDALGIQIPASEMVVNQQDLQGLAQANQSGGPMPGMDPSAQAAGGGGQGAIPPVQGMESMQPAGMPGGMPGGGGGEKTSSMRVTGTPFDSSGLLENLNKASAIQRILRQSR